MYYFPTKERLLAALASDIHENFTAGVIQRAESANVLKGRWTRALLDSLIEDIEQGMRLNVAVRANVMIDHQLIEKVRSDYSKIQNHLEHDGIDPLNGTVVRLAMQGLYHATWFDVAPLDKVDTRKVIEKLYQLIE